MKKRVVSITLAVLMLAMMALTGCGQSQTSGTASAAAASAPTGDFEVPENLAMDWSGSTDTKQV